MNAVIRPLHSLGSNHTNRPKPGLKPLSPELPEWRRRLEEIRIQLDFMARRMTSNPDKPGHYFHEVDLTGHITIANEHAVHLGIPGQDLRRYTEVAIGMSQADHDAHVLALDAALHREEKERQDLFNILTHGPADLATLRETIATLRELDQIPHRLRLAPPVVPEPALPLWLVPAPSLADSND